MGLPEGFGSAPNISPDSKQGIALLAGHTVGFVSRYMAIPAVRIRPILRAAMIIL
jgi:hypothetical protein